MAFDAKRKGERMESLLTTKDVQQLLSCSESHVYNLIRRKQLPAIRWECPGKGASKRTMVRFKSADVLAFIDRGYTGGK